MDGWHRSDYPRLADCDYALIQATSLLDAFIQKTPNIAFIIFHLAFFSAFRPTTSILGLQRFFSTLQKYTSSDRRTVLSLPFWIWDRSHCLSFLPFIQKEKNVDTSCYLFFVASSLLVDSSNFGNDFFCTCTLFLTYIPLSYRIFSLGYSSPDH